MRAGRRIEGGKGNQRGFTYVWMLAAVAVLGFAMAAAGPLWAQRTQREREAELLRVGVAYATAIERYAAASPGGARTLPHRIDDLLLDPRFSTPLRHLRAAYVDPLAPSQAMQPIFRADGSLIGVHSASPLQPLRQVPWTDGRHTIASPAQYSDWQFLAKLTP